MSVYVDDMRAPFQSVPWKRRMVMCHMIADTSEELHQMAEKLELAARWLQYPGTYKEHFDICLSKRKLAIHFGAQEVTRKDLVKMQLSRRSASPSQKEPSK